MTANPINLQMMMKDLESLEGYIEYRRKWRKKTLEAHPYGCCPSWVSADIALDDIEIERQEKSARELRRRIEIHKKALDAQRLSQSRQ